MEEKWEVPSREKVLAFGTPCPLSITYDGTITDTFFDKKIVNVGEAILTLIATSKEAEKDCRVRSGAICISANAIEKTDIGNIVTAKEVFNFPIDGDGCEDGEITKNIDLLFGLKAAYYESQRIYNIYKTYFDSDLISPYDFISWGMEQNSISICKQMIVWKNEQDALRNNIAQQEKELAALTKITDLDNDDKLHPRERKSLLRMIGALINGKKKSVGDIRLLTETSPYGRLDDETIRKYLKELEGIKSKPQPN